MSRRRDFLAALTVFIVGTCLLKSLSIVTLAIATPSTFGQLIGQESAFFIVVLASVLIGLVFWLYARISNYIRVCKLIERIPGPPCHPIPFLGHAGVVLDLDRSRCEYGTYALIYQMLTGVHAVYGRERLLRMWLGARPFVLLYRADAVETVLASNVLTDKSVEYSWLKPWLGEGLVTSNKSKWKIRRKILTPAFHFRILQDFLPIMNEQSCTLINKIKKICSQGGADPYPNLLQLITLCTLDTICETAMGKCVNAQEKESPYVKALHQVSQIVVFRLTRPWLWLDPIFYASRHGKRFRDCLKVMHQFTTQVIKDRKEEWIQNNGHLLGQSSSSSSSPVESDFSSFSRGRQRLAFLDLLLYEHLVSKTLTLQDVREEVDTFMFAGHDTTAMAISWTIYMLGLHQDVLEKVRSEVDQVFDEELDRCQVAEGKEYQSVAVSEEMMKKMKYLDCVLKEVQRVYPTAPFIGRELTEETEIAGYKVPKGTTAGILTFLLHRDPSVFPNPEKFDPSRFEPQNSIGRHPFAYIPFSAGPRNCIGQKFAQMEQKVVICNFVRNFDFYSPDPRDKQVVVGEMVLRPVNNLRVVIKPRTRERQLLTSSS